jgi:hypothetical protein
MRVGVVEEVALDAPGFVEDLLPFGARIDVGAHVAEVERLAGAAVARLQIVRSNDGKRVVLGDQGFGRVG